MGTIAAKNLIDSVANTLQDETNVKWPRDELLGYLNDGQREIVLGKPNAYVKNESIQLVGGTKQTIPERGIVFMRVNRNMGMDGKTPGRVPRHINIRVLDEQIPGWHMAMASSTALHYTFDPEDQKRFYVYPPQPEYSPGQVEIVYSASPDEVADETHAITLDDVYKTALLNYMIYRAYTKDVDYAREDGPAATAYKLFTNLVGAKAQAEDSVQKAGQ
jgi:hypothetical protein